MGNSENSSFSFSTSRQAAVGFGPTLYIIEDNDDNLMLYEWIFTRHLPNYTFHLFSDGLFLQNHLKMALKKPDLILLDLKMPYLSGFEILDQLKQDPQWQAIPVIIYSHSTSEKEAEACYKAGAVDFVSKDISVHGIRSQLEGICKQWINHNRSFA
ncbi:response regulator [Larkinella ripae]